MKTEQTVARRIQSPIGDKACSFTSSENQYLWFDMSIYIHLTLFYHRGMQRRSEELYLIQQNLCEVVQRKWYFSSLQELILLASIPPPALSTHTNITSSFAHICTRTNLPSMTGNSTRLFAGQKLLIPFWVNSHQCNIYIVLGGTWGSLWTPSALCLPRPFFSCSVIHSIVRRYWLWWPEWLYWWCHELLLCMVISQMFTNKVNIC